MQGCATCLAQPSSQRPGCVPFIGPPCVRAPVGERVSRASGSQALGPALAGGLHAAELRSSSRSLCHTAPRALALRGHPCPHHSREPGTAFISSSLHVPSGPWCWCPPEGHTQRAVMRNDWLCSLQVTKALLLSPGSQPLTPRWYPDTEAGHALLLT